MTLLVPLTALPDMLQRHHRCSLPPGRGAVCGPGPEHGQPAHRHHLRMRGYHHSHPDHTGHPVSCPCPQHTHTVTHIGPSSLPPRAFMDQKKKHPLPALPAAPTPGPASEPGIRASALNLGNLLWGSSRTESVGLRECALPGFSFS